MPAPIILLTDFGHADHYAGVLKGVIKTIHPEACIMDLSHGVRPCDILHGAFLLYAGYRFFPRGSIFCVVVDPGVGSDRHMLAVRTRNYYFVGPDNGILWQAASDNTILSMVRLTQHRFFNPSVSNTFHGRDVFAPVCAHLSLNADILEMGEPLDRITEFDFLETRTRDAGLELTVIHIDHFGNMVLNLDIRSFRGRTAAGSFRLLIHDHAVTRICDTYAGAPENELFLLFGSTGFMEISLKNSSAAAYLGARTGDTAILSV